MNICIIPARGGSKRIKKKNIKNFCGKPIILWSIQVAKQSKCFDKIIVSTDDPQIKDLSIENGAEVPFIRPAELSDDFTGTVPVVAHAIKWQIKYFKKPTYVCCVYPTAPFLKPEDLKIWLEKLKNIDVEYVFSATEYNYPIQRSFRILSEQRVEMFQKEHINTRSQDLEHAYHDAGQFYWGKTDTWIKEKPILGNNSVVVKLPKYRVQDIDNHDDWTKAELMFNAYEIKKQK